MLKKLVNEIILSVMVCCGSVVIAVGSSTIDVHAQEYIVEECIECKECVGDDCSNDDTDLLNTELLSSNPQCVHGNIGTYGSTMRPMNKITYAYDPWGRYVEQEWYKCSICGYETHVDYPVTK